MNVSPRNSVRYHCMTPRHVYTRHLTHPITTITVLSLSSYSTLTADILESTPAERLRQIFKSTPYLKHFCLSPVPKILSLQTVLLVFLSVLLSCPFPCLWAPILSSLLKPRMILVLELKSQKSYFLPLHTSSPFLFGELLLLALIIRVLKGSETVTGLAVSVSAIQAYTPSSEDANNVFRVSEYSYPLVLTHENHQFHRAFD